MDKEKTKKDYVRINSVTPKAQGVVTVNITLKVGKEEYVQDIMTPDNSEDIQTVTAQYARQYRNDLKAAKKSNPETEATEWAAVVGTEIEVE